MKSKKDNLIVRLDISDHEKIRLKSEIFGLSKSDLIRTSALSYWQDGDSFKALSAQYDSADNEKKDIILNTLVSLYRHQGFPYYDMSEEDLIKHMGRLTRTTSPLIEGNLLNQNVVGVSLANYFHPHMFSVEYSNTKTKTAVQMFEDDDSLKDCISRWLDLGKVVNPSGLRRILKSRDGARGVVNFKPAISKFIYDTYAPDGGRVLDPCSGYSGRLVGCISTLKGVRYHGIDPDPRTALGNMKCASFFSSHYNGFGEPDYPFGFDFSLGCAEDVMPTLPDASYDLIFTSPPYFDLEKYSSLPNQSYIRYADYRQWLNGFLFPLIKESRRLLKDGGHFALNVKNCGKLRIVDDSLEYAFKAGFELKDRYEMKLANYEFHLKEGKKNWHSEPILIFG